jgi:hypothetical protein
VEEWHRKPGVVIQGRGQRHRWVDVEIWVMLVIKNSKAALRSPPIFVCSSPLPLSFVLIYRSLVLSPTVVPNGN